MNLLIQEAKIIDENLALDDEFKSQAFALLKHLEEHKKRHYYPLSFIKQVTGSSDDGSLQLAMFFSGENIDLLSPRYAYIFDDGSEQYLSIKDFKKALALRRDSLEHGLSLATEDGSVINNFNTLNLNLYFVKNSLYESIDQVDID